MKTLYLILFVSLLVGCSDPGEVNINVKLYDQSATTMVLKVGEFKWKKYNGIWRGTQKGGKPYFFPADPAAADAIDKYMNQ
jgi:hypothetical protein